MQFIALVFFLTYLPLLFFCFSLSLDNHFMTKQQTCLCSQCFLTENPSTCNFCQTGCGCGLMVQNRYFNSNCICVRNSYLLCLWHPYTFYPVVGPDFCLNVENYEQPEVQSCYIDTAHLSCITCQHLLPCRSCDIGRRLFTDTDLDASCLHCCIMPCWFLTAIRKATHV